MIKVPEDLLLSEIYFLVYGQLPSNLCSYRVFFSPRHMYKHMCTHLCVCVHTRTHTHTHTHTHIHGGRDRERERGTFSSYKAIYTILRALPSWSYLALISSQRPLSPHTITLGCRVLIHESGGNASIQTKAEQLFLWN